MSDEGTLTITIKNGAEHYKFEGKWSGVWIKRVIKHIPYQYALWGRGKLRAVKALQAKAEKKSDLIDSKSVIAAISTKTDSTLIKLA